MFFEKRKRFQTYYAEAGGAVAEKPESKDEEKPGSVNLKKVSDYDLREMMKNGNQAAFDEQDRRDFEKAAAKKSKKEKAGAFFVLHDELSDWFVKESSLGIFLNGVKNRTNMMRNTFKALRAPYNGLKSAFPAILK